MNTFSETLLSEIRKATLENHKGFQNRREYIREKILQDGERVVEFLLVTPSSDDFFQTSKKELGNFLRSKGIKTPSNNIVSNKTIYINGRHFVKVVFKVQDTDRYEERLEERRYDIEDTDLWKAEYLYGREELLDLGNYLEENGFNVYINLKSGQKQLPYTSDHFNIDCLCASIY